MKSLAPNEPEIKENMRNNPMNECPDCDPVLQFTIQAKFEDGTWNIFCPEWKCSVYDINLTRIVAELCAEIENHNDGEGPFDYNKWAEKHGFAKLKPEHHPAKRTILRETYKRPLNALPDRC